MMQPSAAEHTPVNKELDHRLKQLLDRLAAPLSRGRADADLIKTLLQEIDETVLPRELTLYFDDQPVAQLRISHRRLLSLVAPPDQENCAKGSDPQYVSKTYAQRLIQLANDLQGGQFRISRKPCEAGIETESCTALLLAQELATPPNNNRLESFLAAINADVVGWLHLEEAGQPPSGAGSKDLLQRLAIVAKAHNNRITTPRLPTQTPGCMILSLAPELDVLLSWDRNETLLVALPAPKVSKATTIWRSVFA